MSIGLLPVALVLLALLAFMVRTALYGRPRSARVVKQGGTVLISEYAMEYAYWLTTPIVAACVRWQVHPDVLSWTSLALHLAGAWFIAQGNWIVGGWLLVGGALCDLLDGAVARARQLASDAGETLDAAIDRVAEMAIFFAYAWYYRQDPFGFVLAAAACMGAVMVSYSRAKGESFGIDAKMGLMQRHERAAYLAAATILSPLLEQFHSNGGGALPRHGLLLATLGLVAVMSNITGIQRIAFIRKELRSRGGTQRR